jgi:regulatory protein
LAVDLSIKGRALRYLAQRDHSRAELARKLLRHARDSAEATAQQQVSAALDALAETGLISERRAADALVGARAAGAGDLKLRQLMRRRGFDDEQIAEALAPLAGAELDRAREVWRRRFGTAAPDAAGRAKQARFLAGRGFSADTIRRVVRGLDAAD